MPVRALADSASRFIPPDADLAGLREAAAGCTACPLHLTGTQTVFGEGRPDAPLMLVGEQPGDKEDLAGRPFVGPAGRLLDEALEAAGIDRTSTYVTNAVKHFKWQGRGKRRIHQKPTWSESVACRPWLDAELEAVRPRVVVALGATAAQSLLGRDFRVTQHRGEVMRETGWAPWVLATVHPSSLLRMPDPAMREQAVGQFVDDMKTVAKQVRAEKKG